MDLIALIPIILLSVAFFIVIRIQRNRASSSMKVLREEAAERVRIVTDPNTDPAVLREYLAMPIPRDATFELHLDVLRALVRNPSLPTELQAAAMNRIASEEIAARSGKSKKGSSRGSRGFFAISDEIVDE